MENQRPFLIIALLAVSAVLYSKWIDFTNPQQSLNQPSIAEQAINDSGIPSTPSAVDLSTVPTTPSDTSTELTDVPDPSSQQVTAELITVTTDLIIAKINPIGGVIERIELKAEPISLDQPEIGFPLLKKSGREIFVAEDGLLANSHKAPNHAGTAYQYSNKIYDLGGADSVTVPLRWVSEDGIQYTKNIVFNRDSYVVDINYDVVNTSSKAWTGFTYAQFSSTELVKKGGGFGQLPSYTGGAIYTPENKYEKIDYKDMANEPLKLNIESGWVAMLQHYFVGAWLPNNGEKKQIYSGVKNKDTNPLYRLGYKSLAPVKIDAGQTGSLSNRVYLGSKEQKRLKRIQKENNIKGLALTVDYGWLTFIADPLFVVLSWIHSVVQNWGWAIIILTLLIKLAFYPLSAASYRSMAGMRKLSPRIQTLKERYKDDRQKFQMEMMALYKKEKINPAGGCLPILVQIPVFIALYWVLLESVEMRQAPFALWWKDLSAPDPTFILPVLMGASMWLQQKLNPAPMDDIQKKVFQIMPIALTFLFLTFPQGLVLYWVVNNILSMAQQWFIYRQMET